jgi:hypothetical protein
MKTKLITAFWLLLLFVAIAHSPNRTESAPNGRTIGANLLYTAANLPDGTLENLTANDALTLSPTAVTGRYLSPILDAPIPYSAVVPSWLADVPESTSFTLQLRTATADNRWSSWFQIEENEDWMLPGVERTIGQIITVSTPDRTHQKFQFALSFGRYDLTAAPALSQLRFDFIDASQGPTAAELAALQAAADQENPAVENGNYPKPPVISRDIWCTDPACDYTDGLTYYPVSHLILHHTASGNIAADWAAVVRAIWYYHTIVLQWGDIGYQYLGDMNGILYEGHLGGDDVIGIHAASANTGSMGLALMGTFTAPDDDPPGISPPPAMMNAAAELFAWKADQKDIDVYDAGMLPNMGWGMPKLGGHRDVDGSTVCPGDQAHLLLPWLRDEVAGRIGFVSPHYYIDELSSAFTKSAGPWNVAPYGCGNNGHAYYAWSTTDPGSGLQWGEWRPPVAFPGTYEIEAYVPYCITGAPETYGATYQITHQNGTSAVTVSHDAHVGRWISLGTYQLIAGNGSVIRLTNLTTTDNNQGVWFDAVRLRPIQIIVPTNLTPPPDSWQPRNVTFTWDLPGGANISTLKLQAAPNSSFNNLLLDLSLPPTATSYNHTFTQDYAKLYWRVIVTTSQNVTATSQPTTFGIDTAAPTSLVTNIYELLDGRYRLYWFGNDATSGISTYTIQYRAAGSATWVNLLANTTQTSAFFDPPDGQTYWFRSQAADLAGNIESPHPNPGDLNTDQAFLLSHVIMLPVVQK